MTAHRATHDLPEVCSPPPSKPLNFLSDVPLSPFAAAATLGGTGPPWQHAGRASGSDSQQQLAQHGDRGGRSGSGALRSNEDCQERAMLDEQENQQPDRCSDGEAVQQAPATWLFSPVRRPAARGGGGMATPAGPARPASAPRAIPSPLLSPGVAMSTPPKEALPAAAPLPTADRLASLAPAPSFGSWLTSAACRPPSPPPAPPAKPAVVVADVVASVTADCRAPRPFQAGGPTPLDRLLAELGDSHYPASCEPGVGKVHTAGRGQVSRGWGLFTPGRLPACTGWQGRMPSACLCRQPCGMYVEAACAAWRALRMCRPADSLCLCAPCDHPLQ